MENFVGKLRRWMNGPEGAAAPSADEVQVAAGALMLYAMKVDGTDQPEEATRVRSVLQDRFALDEDELNVLLSEAAAAEDEAVDLYRFTKVLTANLDQPARQQIIRMMWDVVVADGTIHEFEANLVWRVAELIGVSTQDRIRLRQEVLSESR